MHRISAGTFCASYQEVFQNFLEAYYFQRLIKDSAKYLGAVKWNSIRSHIRQQDSLEKFCYFIKKWKPDCKCKLCKDYIGHIGYIQIVEQFPFIQPFLFHSSYYLFIFKEFSAFLTYVTSFLYFRYILICIYSVYIGQYIFFTVPLFGIFYRIKRKNK